MRFNVGTWLERSAIMEFDGCMTRFDAETEAARLQGVERWQALKFVKEIWNADGERHSQRSGNSDAALAGKRSSNDLSSMQPASQEENRSMPERDEKA